MSLYHIDIGNVGELDKIDYIVLGMPKCGTTTMYKSLDKIKKDTVLHLHTDYTLKKAFNVDWLTIKYILDNVRNRPVYIFNCYREPISRKISQYFQYSPPYSTKSTDIKIKEIREFCLGDSSFFTKLDREEIDEDFNYNLLFESTNINIFEYEFNKSLGYIDIKVDDLNIVPYTLLNINKVEKYIQDNISNEFRLETHRVSGNVGDLFYIKENIKFSDAELDIIYGSKYCKYFYNNEQIEFFRRKYA